MVLLGQWSVVLWNKGKQSCLRTCTVCKPLPLAFKTNLWQRRQQASPLVRPWLSLCSCVGLRFPLSHVQWFHCAPWSLAPPKICYLYRSHWHTSAMRMHWCKHTGWLERRWGWCLCIQRNKLFATCWWLNFHSIFKTISILQLIYTILYRLHCSKVKQQGTCIYCWHWPKHSFSTKINPVLFELWLGQNAECRLGQNLCKMHKF